MIDVDLLRKVRTIVTHEGCADGVASALILKDALPDARIVFVQYNTERWRDLSTELRGLDAPVLFCDMTPRPEDATVFNAAMSVVLDYHRGARELVAKFGDRGVFADEEAEPGVSGALLAFREVWQVLSPLPRGDRATRIEEFAQLAGIRDTWQRSSPKWTEACAQAEALRFWPWEELEPLSTIGDELGSQLGIGPVLLRKGEESTAQSVAEAHLFKVGDLRVAAFDGLGTSDVADKLEGHADLVVGWHCTHGTQGPKMIVSCRSRGSLSALALAKRYGGGGHDRAAGFTLDLKDQPSLNPYDLLEWIVREAVKS